MLIFAAMIAGGAFADTYTYTGGAGTSKWSNDWNASKDTDTGNNLWSSGAAPSSVNDYVIGSSLSWIYFKISSSQFKGKSLTISSPDITFDSFDCHDRLTIPNFTLNAGSRLVTQTCGGYASWAHGLWLTGSPRIDGTLAMAHKVLPDCNYIGGYLSGDLTGNGLVELRGDTKSSPKILGHNWRIVGDNSAFKGKFLFKIAEAMSGGEAFATGVEITSANALGGARDSFTPNAVEIKSWNGLVTVDNDITLNALNSGILMQTNSFFDVAAGKVLTVAEPIRLTGGFFKKGAGTLTLTGGFTFGADGTAAADGFNSTLSVKEGTLRVTQASDLADLDVSMANGTTLELAGTTTAYFRSLNASGPLMILVDCTGLAAGSKQTIALNMPKADAEALVGRVDVMAKGAYASIGSELTVTETGATITLKVPPVTVWHSYTGSSGYSKYSTSWNDLMDGDDSTKYLWDSHSAAVKTDGYTINQDVYFKGVQFNGGALRVKSHRTSVNMTGNLLYVSNLTVDAGAYFRCQSDYDASGSPKLLQGGLWRIDGTLEVMADGVYDKGYLCPTVPMIGSGLVSYGGWGWKTMSRDQRLESDNSRFRGKFKVNLHKTSEGADKAAGLRIVDAKALGGALGVMTPDALTLNANNGLIVGESMTLATENRGILMKEGAYIEVERGKTLTLNEPIRVVNGILKKGSGTLALGGDVTIGENGTTSPNGTNNKLTVQAGTIKAASTNGIAKLAFDFASGTKLELDAFPTDDGVKVGGFYFTGSTPFIAVDTTIPLNIVFPDGYTVQRNENVVLCTVKSENASAVMNKLSVTTTGLARKCKQSFWTEDAGSGLSRIVCEFKRNGFILTVR